MDKVVLKVDVERKELNRLIVDVNKLKQTAQKRIKINVDANSLKSISRHTEKLISDLAELSRFTDKAAAKSLKLQKEQLKLAEAEAKTAKATSAARKELENANKATAKAEEAAAKAAKAKSKLALEDEKVATQAAKTKVQMARLEGQQIKNHAMTERMSKSANTLANNMLKFGQWYLIGKAFSTMSSAMSEAIDTMRKVDDQLVVVRKVTGATREELKAMEEQAYKTASAYGESANQYMESVAGFARAGYKEQSEDLAELATKTQLVGDVDAQTAQQFLLSVDAAYKYRGEVSELNKVLDGANEIDNNYATSIEKIAEGLGKVAPIAAQTHVGIDELSAAIGTITAVTQRSGTEAATALRALFLNIVGDTKTEIDEGVTWTTGEIAGLKDVLWKYSTAAMEAAQATGQVVNPMEAIGGLAKSMQEGLLTEQELMEMVSDIGGKLRTSQLLAIIENWDMYTSMVEDFSDSIGSADKEVANAMDSWSRKTEVLKNKWTEFVQNSIDSDTVKSGLDFLIKGVELLNTDTGVMVTQIGLLSAAVLAAKVAFTKLLVPILANPLFLAVSGGLLLFALPSIIENFGDEAGRAADKLERINDNISDTESEIEQLNSKLEENNRLIQEGVEQGRSRTYINRLQAENDELQRQIDLNEALLKQQRQEASEAAVSGLTSVGEFSGFNTNPQSPTENVIVPLSGTIAEQADNWLDYAEATGEVEESLGDLITNISALRDGLDTADLAQKELFDSTGVLIDRYNALMGVTNDTKKSVEELINVEQIGTSADFVGQLNEAASQVVSAEIRKQHAYDGTTASIMRQLNAQLAILEAAQAQMDRYRGGSVGMEATGAGPGVYQSQIDQIKAIINAAEAYDEYAASHSGGGGGTPKPSTSGGGGTRTPRPPRKPRGESKEEKAKRKALSYLDAELDAMREERNTREDQLELEERILSVKEAQVALANAEADRSVKVYNAATGTWEWQANAKTVEDARKSLTDAQNGLQDFVNEVKYESRVEQINKKKKDVQSGKLKPSAIKKKGPNYTMQPTPEFLENVLGVDNGKETLKTLESLGIVVSGRGYGEAKPLSGTVDNRIGSQHNGNVYSIGGVTISENQAKSMTVYELAQLSGGLSAYKNGF